MEEEKKSLCSNFKQILYKNLHLFHILFFAIFLLILFLVSRYSCNNKLLNIWQPYGDKTNCTQDLESSNLYISELKNQISQLDEYKSHIEAYGCDSNTFDPFGGSNFETVVTGYFRNENVGSEGFDLDAGFFVITEYQNPEFEQSISEGIEIGNTVNMFKDGNYLFRLGCYEDGKILTDGEVEDELDESYIDNATLVKILNSTANNPISLRLYFRERGGSGCDCCNLAYMVRAEE